MKPLEFLMLKSLLNLSRLENLLLITQKNSMPSKTITMYLLKKSQVN